LTRGAVVKSKTSPVANKELECFNLLQKEKDRLVKLEHVLGDILPTIKKFSQISLLQIQKETTNQELKKKIIKRALPLTSHFNSQLIELFNDTKL
jgi:hypothetical protein